MKPLAVLGLAAAVLLPLWLFDPSTSGVFPPCIFRALTGWQCPGCGSARALHDLLHGHIAAALGSNPVAVVVLPLIAIEAARHAAGARPSLSSRLRGRTILAIASGLVLFAVVRNV
jgi:hypothetical protein